ncbi:MAG TPA: APC family permease [Pseudonocardiaceae bacterium]|nr:APC family permease [Pseudonocardiaceae bacterium]
MLRGTRRGFRRDVGPLALTFVSLGSIIGSGWLLGASTAATSAGGSSILSWLLGGLIIVLLALVHAELGAAYPLAGGTARWPRVAFGSLGGFTAGWVSWLANAMLGPIEVEAALGYLDHQWHGLISGDGGLTPAGLTAATALMSLFAVINVLGVRWLAGSNSIVVAWKIAVPVLTVAVLIVVSFHAANFTTGGGFAPYGVHGVLAALPLGIVFALQGFEQATQLGSEARDPQRNVPRAVIGSVILGTLLYLALEIAFIGALTPAGLQQGWANSVGKGDFGPYVTLAAELGLGWLAVILYLDAFISPAGTGLVSVGSSGRLAYALGYAGYVPRAASRISPRGVPHVSIMLAFVVGLVFFLLFPSWKDLVQLITAATGIMYAFAPITLLALRKADPDRARPYRLPIAPVLAPVAFVAANEIVYWTSWATVHKLMLVVAAGYLIFGTSYVLSRPLERPPLDSWSLAWITPWLAGLTVISYLGRYDGTKLIPEWVDIGVVAAFSLLICYAAVHFRLSTERVTATVAADQREAPD